MDRWMMSGQYERLVEAALKRLAVLFSCLLLAGIPSSAEASSVRLWLAPTGGVSSYRMNSINHQIAILNQIFRPPYQVDEISSGPSVGLQLGADLGSHWMAALRYERLWANESAAISEYDLPAHVFATSAGYRLQPSSQIVLGFNLGVGIVALADGSISRPLELSGNGAAIEGTLELDYRTWHRIGFLLQAGYRGAKVEGIESNGAAMRSPDDGTPIDVDYTGVVLRLGMKFFPR